MAKGYVTTMVIYSLVDPNTNEDRYVGCTANMKRRMSEYSRPSLVAKHHNLRLGEWLESLGSKGVKPLVQVLETIPAEEWAERESHWISLMRASGADLCNVAPGGPGVTSPHTEAAKQKMRGRVVSKESRERMSRAHMGVRLSDATRAKMSASRMGHKVSDKARQKLAERHVVLKCECGSMRCKTCKARHHSRLFRERNRKGRL